jgi:hypothetical protein
MIHLWSWPNINFVILIVWRWRRGGGMRGERKEVEWWTRWWLLRWGPLLSCGGIDGQMSRVWWAGPRHDPFNSAWANPARASCGAWAVDSARSAGSAWHDFFYFTYVQFIFNIINTWSWFFYWLDSFAQCLPPLFHLGVGSNPTFYLGAKYNRTNCLLLAHLGMTNFARLAEQMGHSKWFLLCI